MDAKEQEAGERRVGALLIDPLTRRGLMRPTGMTVEQFGLMLEGLRSKLAYMAPEKLAALEEVVAANPAGKDRDRFPIANFILDQAAQIQPPGDDASPLMRAVFAHDLGLTAIEGGWAPELGVELRRNRRWPNTYVLAQVQRDAEAAINRLRGLELRLSRGEDIGQEAEAWRAKRLTALAKCRRIRALGLGEEAA